ncbi:MAG: hypothetical protein NWE91_01500 [Candidatus Bathyarchaeota archaeon]|nr:hypothetical protein [Candidatus Bathyarchaeota archaeon]
MGKINGDFYEWKESNAKKIPEKSGVYGLFESKTEESLIYIGSTSNLRERFTHYWETEFSEDPCKKTTKWYKREITNSYKEREKELLEQYKKEHDGKLPKCNEKIS